MGRQWSDDFHHSVHTLLTGENSGYYEDFGDVRHLASTLQQGWYYAGQYSRHRRRRHGNAPPPFKGSNYVVCTQNHDQVGKPRSWRAHQLPCGLRKLETGGGCKFAFSFRALTVHGRGIWRDGAVPILHQPRRRKFGQSSASRTNGGISCLSVQGQIRIRRLNHIRPLATEPKSRKRKSRITRCCASTRCCFVFATNTVWVMRSAVGQEFGRRRAAGAAGHTREPNRDAVQLRGCSRCSGKRNSRR